MTWSNLYAKAAGEKGVALVEYVVLMLAVAIAVPGLVLLGDRVPELFEKPPAFEIGIPEGGSPGTTVVIPACVGTGQCAPPEEAAEYCLANTTDGEICSIMPMVVATPATGGEPSFLVPIMPSDPELAYAVSDRNEDYPDPVYANSPSSSHGNQSDLMEHTANYAHPAAQYCAGRGGALPAVNDMEAMAQHADKLGLARAIYLTSSQYWASGGHNPPPVLKPLNYARNFDVADFQDGRNPLGHGFVQHAYRVRCVYR
jgi:putative hemolysin